MISLGLLTRQWKLSLKAQLITSNTKPCYNSLMSDKKSLIKSTPKPKVPTQKGPSDISNWKDKTTFTPERRVIIEMDQSIDKIIVAE